MRITTMYKNLMTSAKYFILFYLRFQDGKYFTRLEYILILEKWFDNICSLFLFNSDISKRVDHLTCNITSPPLSTMHD